MWALPTTFVALQTGNFQITGIPLALLGTLLAWSARPALGGGLLAYATLGKIFPAMLVLHIVATRRWRLVAWIAAWGAALTGLTAVVFGLEPFIHFVRDEIPQLASGAAFPQTEEPSASPVNQSVYGFTVKLRALGLAALDQANGRHVARVYAVLLAALAIASGLRSRAEGPAGDERSRLDQAGMWLGLLNLASFAGPFVGGAYGSAGHGMAGGAAGGWRRYRRSTLGMARGTAPDVSGAVGYAGPWRRAAGRGHAHSLGGLAGLGGRGERVGGVATPHGGTRPDRGGHGRCRTGHDPCPPELKFRRHMRRS